MCSQKITNCSQKFTDCSRKITDCPRKITDCSRKFTDCPQDIIRASIAEGSKSQDSKNRLTACSAIEKKDYNTVPIYLSLA